MAERKVKVNLEVKAADARKDIRATAADVDKLIRSTEAAGVSLDEMAADAKQAGRKLDDMADQAKQADRDLDAMAASADLAGRATDKLGTKARISGQNLREMKNELGRLDRQIDETVAHLKLLEHQFATTGDQSLLKLIAADRTRIAQLRRIRGDLTPEAPGTAGSGFLSGSGGMPLIVAGIVAAVVAAAPGIGAIIGGAVVGGVGAGGVVGGIIAAAHDARVRDAFSEMGGHLRDSFFESGRPFLGPLLHETAQLQATAGTAIGILRRGFEDLAPVLHPLVLGFDGFVEALGPGLSNAFKAAKPLLRAFANELPRIGQAISDALSDMASASDGGVEGMIALTHAVEGFIRGVGAFVHAMEVTYDWLVRNTHAAAEFGLTLVEGFPALTPFADKLRGIRDQTQGYMDAAKAAGDASKDFAFSLDGTATSASDAAQKIQDLNDAINTLFHKQMSWDEAQIHLRTGMRDLVKELTTGKRTLAENSVEGDKNREAIIGQIQKIEDARDAYANLTHDVAGANKKYEDQLEALRRLLIKLGYQKDAVNGIIDAYRGIPVETTAKLTTPGLTTTRSMLDKVEDTLNRLDGRVVKTFYEIYEQHREDARQYRAAGGPVFPGTNYVVGERGPEIVRFGAAGTVIPAPQTAAMMRGFARAGATTTTTVVHEHRHTLIVEGTGVLSGLRREIGLLGGDVQTALGSRTRVGG